MTARAGELPVTYSAVVHNTSLLHTILHLHSSLSPFLQYLFFLHQRRWPTLAHGAPSDISLPLRRSALLTFKSSVYLQRRWYSLFVNCLELTACPARDSADLQCLLHLASQPLS